MSNNYIFSYTYTYKAIYSKRREEVEKERDLHKKAIDTANDADTRTFHMHMHRELSEIVERYNNILRRLEKEQDENN